MPTYQYQCESCGYVFEQYQSIIDNALKTCPHCKEEALTKVISGGAGYFLRDSGVMPTSSPNKDMESEPKPKRHSCGHFHDHDPEHDHGDHHHHDHSHDVHHHDDHGHEHDHDHQHHQGCNHHDH